MTNNIEETLKERGSTYGDFGEEARLVEAIMSSLGGCCAVPVNAHAYHATYMIVTKLARLWQGDIDHVDSWHDIAGYAELARRGAEKNDDIIKTTKKERKNVKQ